MTTSWTSRIKPTVTWVYNRLRCYLLQEDSSFLLLEDGFKILISGNSPDAWTKRTSPSTSWTSRVKP